MLTRQPSLPPGQREARRFIRFGLGRFMKARFVLDAAVSLTLRGDVENELTIGEQLAVLPRCEQIMDFHCVTTWSVLGLRWSGWRFQDFHKAVVVPSARPDAGAQLVVLRGKDGYCSCLPLDDLLADNVMLADSVNGEPLGLEHGAPLRLVAPAHYGYKSVKHLVAIEYWADRRHYRFPEPYPSFIDHPRARVALEERGLLFPAWLLKAIYRWFIPERMGWPKV